MSDSRCAPISWGGFASELIRKAGNHSAGLRKGKKKILGRRGLGSEAPAEPISRGTGEMGLRKRKYEGCALVPRFKGSPGGLALPISGLAAFLQRLTPQSYRVLIAPARMRNEDLGGIIEVDGLGSG